MQIVLMDLLEMTFEFINEFDNIYLGNSEIFFVHETNYCSFSLKTLIQIVKKKKNIRNVTDLRKSLFIKEVCVFVE